MRSCLVELVGFSALLGGAAFLSRRKSFLRSDVPSHASSLGTWCSGITSASHAEGPGFKSQCVHIFRILFSSAGGGRTFALLSAGAKGFRLGVFRSDVGQRSLQSRAARLLRRRVCGEPCSKRCECASRALAKLALLDLCTRWELLLWVIPSDPSACAP